jgi:predicted nucleic acid-binding protein
MIAYLRGEQGVEVVSALLSEAECACFAHHCQVNEVFWFFCREAGEDRAESALNDLLHDGVLFQDDFDLEFCKQAARWRTLARLSFADAFGLTLAQRLGADFVTSDRHDLEPIQQSGWLPIVFIRPLRRTHTVRARLTNRLADTIARLRELDCAEGVDGDWKDACRRV